MCAGCMACVEACPTSAIEIVKRIEFYDAIVDEGRCVDCGLCLRLCQQHNPVNYNEPICWFQGWASDWQERMTSSSGGVASALMRSFAENGGAVVSCAFDKGKFVYETCTDHNGINKFKGSKYVKSDPHGIYGVVKGLLASGKKVLFVGLPCHVSAMKLYLGAKLGGNLYTIDLICHGTPDPQLLDIYLKSINVSIMDIEEIRFRSKSSFGIEGRAMQTIDSLSIDPYTMAFLNGLSYTDNCYKCPYAKTARVADITLGDSWGTDLSNESDSGVSLVMCMSRKGKDLLDGAGIELFDVDASKAIAHNEQLRHPMNIPKFRNRFVKGIKLGFPFSIVVFSCYPKSSIKQAVKRIIAKAVKKRGEGYGITIVLNDGNNIDI